MTSDNEQPNDRPTNTDPETPGSPAPTPLPASEPAPVVSLPLATAPANSRAPISRRVFMGAGAVVAAALLFGSGFALGHATSGDDHGARRPMAMRNAAQRAPRDGNQQAPGQQQGLQRRNQQQRDQQQPQQQQGAPNQQQRQ